MKALRYSIGASLSAAMLVACGSANEIGSLTPVSITPQSLRTPVRQQIRQSGVTETSLYNFAGGTDGRNPYFGKLTKIGNTLYGTTALGGGPNCYQYGDGCGTVFAITTSGAYHQIYAFGGIGGGNDGAIPTSHLAVVNGKLYGTTNQGGAYGQGAFFKITTSGAEKVLHSFTKSYGDGASPASGPVSVGGTMYGSTQVGGASDCGAIYKITTSGTESVLYSFACGSDGRGPTGDLIYRNGVLYGTTAYGGGICSGSGCGTVFSVTTSGTERVLYRFAAGTDGYVPYAGLTDINGTLYGTTEVGGGSGCYNQGCGTVFKITTAGAYTQLHAFTSNPDGQFPIGGLTNVSGKLYGTTESGGIGYGTVYKITPSGAESVVYSFTGTDGAGPYAGVQYVQGKLYGTTDAGGYSYGNIYSLSGF